MPVGSSETHWPDHLHGVCGKEHPNQCSHAEQMVLLLLGIFKRERAKMEVSGAGGGGWGSLHHSPRSALRCSPRCLLISVGSLSYA